MNTTLERPAEDQALIVVELSAKEWKAALDQAKATALGATEEQIRQVAINQTASQALIQMSGAEKLKIATAPTIEAKDEPDGGITISIQCQTIPDVKLGEYKGLNIVKDPAALTDEEINNELMRQIASSQTWITQPADTPAELGDRVVIDFVGEKDGVPFEGGTGKAFPLVLGSQSFIPGFEDQLIGIKAGESRDVKLSFPQNYFEPSLAGQPVVFHCTCQAVEKEVQPELTDEFVALLKLEGVKSVEELKAKVKAEMQLLKEQEAEGKAISQLLEKIIETSEITIPDELKKSQVEQSIEQYRMNLQQYGMNLEQYLQISNQTMEEFEKAMTPDVIRNIQATLVLEAVAESENITATLEEVNKEYELLERVYNLPADQLKQVIPQGSIITDLIQRKTIDFLKANNIK